jgi:hypothetical protein
MWNIILVSNLNLNMLRADETSFDRGRPRRFLFKSHRIGLLPIFTLMLSTFSGSFLLKKAWWHEPALQCCGLEQSSQMMSEPRILRSEEMGVQMNE